MPDGTAIDDFISHWRETGGSELANTQSFINGLCALLGVVVPNGSRADDTHNDYVFERRVFQDNGDGTRDFGRIDAYKRGCFILEAKQGSVDVGEMQELPRSPAIVRIVRGTAFILPSSILPQIPPNANNFALSFGLTRSSSARPAKAKKSDRLSKISPPF